MPGRTAWPLPRSQSCSSRALLVQVINFDAIAVFGGALKEIAEADITTGEEVFATLFGLAIMLSVYYAPGLSSTCSDPNGQFRSSVA